MKLKFLIIKAQSAEHLANLAILGTLMTFSLQVWSPPSDPTSNIVEKSYKV